MTSPHCSDPSRCSQCLGAAPRIVTVIAGVNHVDGAPEISQPKWRASAQRGGEANKRNHAPKPAKRRPQVRR